MEVILDGHTVFELARILLKPCTRASAWVQGEGFDGTPVTYWSRFCEYHELLAKQQGVPTDLQPEEGDVTAAAFELVRPELVQCAWWICERHYYWCERLRDWLLRAGLEVRGAPVVSAIHALAKRYSAGWYLPADHACAYVLPYAMSQPDYDATIAHEVCHAYQRELLPAAEGHGEAWQTLMLRVVGNAGLPRCITFHEYAVQEEIALGKSILPQVRAAKAAMRMPGQRAD